MIYIMGAGGHAKVVADILESCHFSVAGFFDNDVAKTIWSYPTYQWPGPFIINEDTLVLAIGSNETRQKLSTALQAKFVKAIHPAATVARRVIVGEGTVIMAGATINTDTTIGKHCIINTSASVDHDCSIGDFVHISPNATLSGTVRVGHLSHIGAGATVIQNITIGSNVTIGAGAVVVSDIPDNCVAVGCPAKIIKTKN